MYFERLTGFNEEVALPFAQNLMEDYSKVGEMRIEVFEQIITCLPRTKEYFLAIGEVIYTYDFFIISPLPWYISKHAVKIKFRANVPFIDPLQGGTNLGTPSPTLYIHP